MLGFLKFLLSAAGMPGKTEAELEASLPDIAKLDDEAKQLDPIVRDAMPLIEQAEPHIMALLQIEAKLQPLAVKAWPILQKAYPEIVAVAPTAEDLIAFIRARAQS